MLVAVQERGSAKSTWYHTTSFSWCATASLYVTISMAEAMQRRGNGDPVLYGRAYPPSKSYDRRVQLCW